MLVLLHTGANERFVLLLFVHVWTSLISKTSQPKLNCNSALLRTIGVDNILPGIFATSFHLLLSIIFLLITSYRVRYKRFSIQFPYCSFRGYTFTIPNWREKSWINERRPVVTIQQNRPAVRFKNGNYYCWLMTAHVLKWYCYSWLGENTTI